METPIQPPVPPTPRRRHRRREVDQPKADLWCEWTILGLVFSILAFTPLAFGAIRPKDFVVVEWLMTLTLVAWLVRFWINPQHRLLWPPVCWGVVAFMGYAVIRYLSADVEYVARQEMIKVMIYGFLFLVILHNFYRVETIQLISIVLLTLAVLIAMYGLTQFLTGSDYVWGFVRPAGYHKRGSGTFINPNHFAGYLEMLLPLALAYTLTGRFTAVGKVLAGYATLVIFAGIFVSVSVGGWLATGGALVLLFLWLFRMRNFRVPAILLLVGLAVVATGFVLKTELSPSRRDHLSSVLQGNDFRPMVWKASMKMWQEHFWLGVGPGHFDVRWPGYRPLEKYPDASQVPPQWVHNDYLNTLVDWGLVGGILVLAPFLLFYYRVFSGWKYLQRAQSDLGIKSSNKATFVMGGALGLFAILIHSVVDFNMHIPANAILAVTLLALVTAHFRYMTESYWHTLRLPLRLVITLVLVLAAFYLGQQSWRSTRECYWLSKADHRAYASPDEGAALEKALAVEDRNYESFHRLGENERLRSWDSENKAGIEAAMTNFEKSSVLNRFYPWNPIHYGMCLDWLGKTNEALASFQKAYSLDPIGYYTSAHMGWHYVQINDWPKAKEWFEKSRWLYWRTNNVMAFSYLDIVNRRMAEMNTNR